MGAGQKFQIPSTSVTAIPSARQEHQAGGIDGKSPTELLDSNPLEAEAAGLFYQQLVNSGEAMPD